LSINPLYNAGAWAIIKTFALEDISLPETEKRLQSHLGPRYSGADWKVAFDMVLEAEDDTAAAVAAIEKLELELDANKSQHLPLSSNAKTVDVIFYQQTLSERRRKCAEMEVVVSGGGGGDGSKWRWRRP
jgi:hypothetical protein